jgi:arylsulfatase A-like enzyme
MLLSGRTVFHIDEKLQRGQTWPALFGRAGYATFMTGKWHNGAPSVPLSFQTARSVFLGGMTDPLNASVSDLAEGRMTEARPASNHTCAVFADEAIRFLNEQAQARKPFLCYVAFNAPHDPHIVPGDFPVRYAPEDIPLPANFLPQHPWDNGDMTLRDEELLPWPRMPAQVRSMLADYYRYVSYLDLQVGRVLDALSALPLATNTIVVFAADSGVARGSHGLIGKQNLYEHSVRVPLIIAGPGIPTDLNSDAMVYLTDVFPTIGKLCGVPAPIMNEGAEFTPALLNPDRPARPHLVFAYRNVQRAIRDDRWKLIRYPRIDKTQLFDLRSDPNEMINLAYAPEHAARVAGLTALLTKELEQLGDNVPLKVKNPRSAVWVPPARNSAAPGSPPGTNPRSASSSDLP